METTSGPTAETTVWAMGQFAGAVLGDRRRERRLVAVAASCAAQPQSSVARAMPSWSATKAAYRLLREPDVTLAAVTAPHRTQTLAAAGTGGVVLLLQDTTDGDFTAHPKTTGLGPIGDGRGRGFFLQSVLAVRPNAPVPDLIGIAHVEAFDRVAVPTKTETSRQRRDRARESDHWVTAVEAIGSPPAGASWVMVGDRGADIFRLFTTCQAQGQQFVIRVAQDRKTQTADGADQLLLTGIRTHAPGPERRPVAVASRPGKPGRTAEVTMVWQALALPPPVGTRDLSVVPCWVIRVWEPNPPDEVDPLEWVLVTTVPITNDADAWERVAWYRLRWMIEEYHQALKTGCRIEATQLREQQAIWALLGICVPIAVRLLQLRTTARTDPEGDATTVLPPATIAVLAAVTQTRPDAMTARTAWRLVARLGGHLGRTSDGDPGWRSLWWGWQRLQDLLAGARIGANLASG